MLNSFGKVHGMFTVTRPRPPEDHLASTVTPTQQPTQRRMDIEGLRAVAAILVAVYHIWTHRISGAVDVFFFIAAYVMMMSVLRRIAAGRRFSAKSVVDSYRSLLYRMGPHVWLVVAVTTLAGWLLMSSSYWQAIRDQAIAAALFVVNYYFAANSVTYLGAGTSSSLVQHLWAMGVQVQFFLVFPLLVWLACVIGRRLSRGSRQLNTIQSTRLALCVVFGVVTVASFMYARFEVINVQSVAYFDTIARTWEFGLGALFAIIAPRIKVNRWVQIIGGWLGLFILVTFGMVLDVAKTFPGTMALIPVGAAALVMYSGQYRDDMSAESLSVGRMLSVKPLTWIGSLSFGLYLWHWPVLTIVRAQTGSNQINLFTGIGIIAVSIGLSWLSTHLVVSVIRNWSRGAESRTRFRALAATMALVLAVGGSVVGINHANDAAIAAAPNGNPGAAVLFNPSLKSKVVGLQPAFAALANDQWDEWGQRCSDIKLSHGSVRKCVAGNPSATLNVYSIGDSHTSMWMSVFKPALKQGKLRLTNFFVGACPITVDGNDKYAPVEDCKAGVAEELRQVLQDKPSVVFTMGNVSRAGDSTYHYSAGFVKAINIIQRANIPTVLLRDVPFYSFDRAKCVEDHLQDANKCAVKTSTVLGDQSFANSLPKTLDQQRLATFDMSDLLCQNGLCPVVIGGVLVNVDTNHLTRDYIFTMSGEFWNRFSAAYKRASQTSN